MTRLATSWLVYRLTDSAFLLGVVNFAGQIPAFFIPPFAGVWVDRWDRHKVLIATQVFAMLQSLAMAALTLSGHINMTWVIGLTLFQGRHVEHQVDSARSPTMTLRAARL